MKSSCLLQNDSEMPMGMVSLLTAPLVSDSAEEDSVSFPPQQKQ